MTRRFNVAIVGSGPSGFYVAEALLQADMEIQVDMIERLPVPFGLVRYGVAPDHQKLKSVTAQFEDIASHENFSFFGNLQLGRDIDISELTRVYDAVVIATGALSDRPLGIDGEDLKGSVSATEFVAWYNGHPDYRNREFDLSHPNAVIVGNGNVALDVCRILSKSIDELKTSDICAHALDALSESRIENIYLVGRRGPAQAKFTTKELREFGTLVDAEAVTEPSELELNEPSLTELQGPDGAGAARNLGIFRSFASVNHPRQTKRRIHFRFFLSPSRILGQEGVESIEFEKMRLKGPAFEQTVEATGEDFLVPAGLIVRSVGYRGVEIPGVPYDSRRGTIPHSDGRVQGMDGATVKGIYTAGWIKRGPSGVIGTNRACAVDTASAILSDLVTLGEGDRQNSITKRDQFLKSLQTPSFQLVNLEGWHKIDALERTNGAMIGKPREKMTSIQEMLDVSNRQQFPVAAAG
ncbi:FAD-dependent oxidoreductase [Rhizobium sp. NFACC06-2]|uniref:FAD-dependent oxidoreductase n=1 Tax=Rhizobium sp. NFACC06-2 TaxID=1566264 RepID=UPI0008764A9F|nr:FAD-dependent oxidoreductase [Rhizobium sp. NFACC06-2]SCY84538.1 ferredoxin--NADP+ reductase [Rhizobium sp. NFACC06-2]